MSKAVLKTKQTTIAMLPASKYKPKNQLAPHTKNSKDSRINKAWRSFHLNCMPNKLGSYLPTTEYHIPVRKLTNVKEYIYSIFYFY